MRTYSDVIIVGAGASGLMCGGLLAQKLCCAKLSKTVRITILEKNSRIGKKLSATGNGRCNFTNLHMSGDCYYGNPDWISSILNRVTPKEVVKRFADLGVLCRERDGYVYPHTNQAGTVIRGLQQACECEAVDIELDCFVRQIHRDKKRDGFEVVTDRGTIGCRILVVATGSAAGREAGGDESGYEIVKHMGIDVGAIYPGLTGLCSTGKWWKKVAGTRIQGTFSLFIEDELYGEERGEIQIVKDGVSGIPVFQLCRMAAEAMGQGKRVFGEIDFVPALTAVEVKQWKEKKGIQGLVPEKWIPILEKREIDSLKHFRFDVTGTFGLERAQVAAGGVDVGQIDSDTMEAREIPNAFLLGEILDVDGKCGGYNLHFAWATAMLAAEEIEKRLKKST